MTTPLTSYQHRPVPGRYFPSWIQREFVLVQQGIVGSAASGLSPYAILPGEVRPTAFNQRFPACDVRRYGAVCDGVTDDSAAVQAAFTSSAGILAATGWNYPVMVPGPTACNNIGESANGLRVVGNGVRFCYLVKNADGPLLTLTGSDCGTFAVGFRGDASTPTFTGDNVVFAGDRCGMTDSLSLWAYGRGVKCTGAAFTWLPGDGSLCQTADTSASGYDMELGVSGTATLYHKIFGLYSSQNTGGILCTDTGNVQIVGGQFGKLTIAAGTAPSGTNGGQTMGARILGDVTVDLPNALFTGNEFGGSVDFVFSAGTSGCVLDQTNDFGTGATITNNGNANNVIIKNVSSGGSAQLRYGDDSALAVMTIDQGAGKFTFPSLTTSGNTSIATAATNVGFYGTTPIPRQVLATGAGHTVDDVITAFQNLGLVSQT